MLRYKHVHIFKYKYLLFMDDRMNYFSLTNHGAPHIAVGNKFLGRCVLLM